MIDDQIYLNIIKQLTIILNDFVGECIDDKGNPKEPSKKALNKVRGYIPFTFSNSIVKKK